MYNVASDPLLVNAIFSGNAAHKGGGAIYNEGSHPTLTNVAFDANSAASGGGIYNEESKPRIQNSILWDNRASAGPQILNTSTSTPTLTYCDVRDSGGSGAGWDAALGVDGGGNLDADPLFVAPVLPVVAAGAGGGEVPQTAVWDLRLRAGSPAIDAGDNDLLPPGVITDLTGRPRIVNGRVDLGAYEFGFGIYLPLSMRTAAP
jgi:predicted outer membrane repeat protein